MPHGADRAPSSIGAAISSGCFYETRGLAHAIITYLATAP
jgi:hypothetical protein